MANDAPIGANDRLHEIAAKLEQSHLVYLQTDDSPLKLQQRRKLEGFIKEYLCLVPNESKYVFQETADILHRSAATLRDFSGYRAITAWCAISLYAANLLAQPWRKEYRTLRTYSGYYKHEIEANLIGAELMFEQMGYKHTGLGVLTLEGPIDPDKVSSVSRDAIVAYVECQILKQIWEGVSRKFTATWLEVLEFRENHVGPPEQAIRALNHRFLGKLHQNRARIAYYGDYRYMQPQSFDAFQSVPCHALPGGYGMTMPACRSDYRYIEETGKYGHYPTTDLANRCATTYGYLPPVNKYYPNTQPVPFCATAPTCTQRVPTGRLIEVDVPVSVTDYEPAYDAKCQPIVDLDEMDFCGRKSNDDYDYAQPEKKAGTAKKESHDWDFVYKNLESRGYSKDLGDRDEVAWREPEVRVDRPKTSRAGDERRTAKSSEPNEMTPSMTNGRAVHQESLSCKKKSSSFDLSSSQEYRENQGRCDSRTLPAQRSHRSTEQIARLTDSMRSVELSRSAESVPEDRLEWNCATCTYLNAPRRETCEMCSKSRRKGNEDKPLVSGGKTCKKCTLVNDKGLTHCAVCDASLETAPTYI